MAMISARRAVVIGVGIDRTHKERVRLLLGDELARGPKAELGQRVDTTFDYWLE